MTICAATLAAISCGSVFMGANSYIGNAPNMMVKAIAEQQRHRDADLLWLYGVVVCDADSAVPCDDAIFF